MYPTPAEPPDAAPARSFSDESGATRRAGRMVLGLLLAATFLRGAAWAAVVPPLHPNDEAQHVLRVRSVAGDLPVNPPTATDPATVPLDLARLADRVGLGTVERDRDLKIPPTPLAATGEADAGRDPRTVGVPDHPDGLVRHRGFDGQHPPLFYWLTSVVYRAVGRLEVGGQLLAMRLTVALIGVGVAATAWAIGRALWPGSAGRPLVLGAAVAFQPTAGFYESVFNNESLVILLFSLVLLIVVRASRRPLSWPTAGLLAAVAGAGLLTKVTFLAAAPLLAAVAVWQFAAFDDRARTLARWAAVALACAAVAAPWYVPAVAGARSVAGAVAGPDATAESLGLLDRVGGDDLRKQFDRVLKGEYWGSSLGNGWNRADPAIPTPARLVTMYVALLASLATAGWVAWRIAVALQERSLRALADSAAPGLIVLGLANGLLVAFLVLLDWRFKAATGEGFRLRGQYLMPGIAGAMAWVAFGVGLLRPAWLRTAGLVGIAGGMVGVNGYTLLFVVGPRYYGTTLGDLPGAVARVQPIAPAVVSTVLVLLAAVAAGFLAGLARVVWVDETVDEASDGSGRQARNFADSSGEGSRQASARPNT